MRNSVVGGWLRDRWVKMGFSAAGLARSLSISRSTLERAATGGRISRKTLERLAGPLKLPREAVDALARPDVTREQLDALAAVLKFVVLWFAVDLASVCLKLAGLGGWR